MPTLHERRRFEIARHELLHAVVAISLGIPVGAIEVTAIEGSTEIAVPTVSQLGRLGDADAMVQRLAVLLAPYRQYEAPKGYDAVVFEGLRASWQHQFPSFVHLERQARVLTGEALAGHLARIEALAEHLAATGRITGAEVKAEMRRKAPGSRSTNDWARLYLGRDMTVEECRLAAMYGC